MSIKDMAGDILGQAKDALDADGDGKVEATEVLGAVADRVKETADAAVQAAGEVKDALDADGDGKVSFDEVKTAAAGVGQKVTGAIGGLADKISGE